MTVREGLAQRPMMAPIGRDTELRAPKIRAANTDERKKSMKASRTQCAAISIGYRDMAVESLVVIRVLPYTVDGRKS
jgi:hypothetical protein